MGTHTQAFYSFLQKGPSARTHGADRRQVLYCCHALPWAAPSPSSEDCHLWRRADCEELTSGCTGDADKFSQIHREEVGRGVRDRVKGRPQVGCPEAGKVAHPWQPSPWVLRQQGELGPLRQDYAGSAYLCLFRAWHLIVGAPGNG